MEILHIPQTKIEKAAEAAAHTLRQGGIVLFPTDTIYGLAVNALDIDAVCRLRSLKQRQRKQPISVVVPSIEHVEKYATLTPCAKRLAEAHLPGPLTLVVPAGPKLPKDLQLNGTIGIRIPDDPFCLMLARKLELPFTATSANLSGRETPWSITQILQQFGENAGFIDLIIDAGERRAAFASTVVLAVEEPPRILRQGALTCDDLGIPEPYASLRNA